MRAALSARGMVAGLSALAMIAALWVFARAAPGLGDWAFGLAGVILAVPLALVRAHWAATRRSHNLLILNQDGWLHRALSGPVLRVTLALVRALILTFVLLVRVIALIPADWLALVVAGTGVPLGAALGQRVVGAQIATPHRLAGTLRIGRYIGSALGLAAYLVLRDLPVPPPEGPFRSPLIEQAVLLGAQWRLLEDFALGQLSVLGDWGRWAAVLVSVLGNLALVWTATGIAAGLMLPRDALRRALAPVGADRPAPVAIGWMTALATVITLFVYAPVLAMAEAALRAVPAENRPSDVFVTQVEQIGGQFFEPGTIAELTGRRIEAQANAAPEARAALLDQVDAGFAAMEANIDPFLDWYYSLPAEYGRIAHLLAGDFESYLAGKMGEYLSEGDPFGGLDTALARWEAAEEAMQPALEAELESLARARRVEIAPGQPIAIVGSAEAAVFGAMPSISDRLTTRLAITGGTAGLAAALTTAVMVKLGTKGVTKLAAKAALKVAASKGAGGTAGAGAGAAGGAIVGSVVPGIGTAAGAVIGGLIGGLAVGAGTDFLLVKLEEALSRDQLRAEMVSALDAARADMHGLIDADPSGK